MVMDEDGLGHCRDCRMWPSKWEVKEKEECKMILWGPQS